MSQIKNDTNKINNSTYGLVVEVIVAIKLVYFLLHRIEHFWRILFLDGEFEFTTEEECK